METESKYKWSNPPAGAKSIYPPAEAESIYPPAGEESMYPPAGAKSIYPPVINHLSNSGQTPANRFICINKHALVIFIPCVKCVQTRYFLKMVPSPTCALRDR